jgi:predicted Zn finger-like uncharacterized protein
VELIRRAVLARADKRTVDMKIVCGSCQAKYSIADEKVAGKVFKIRCKRCSEVIVVRGDQEASGASAAQAGDEAAPDAIWHVVINGEQAGPYAPSQLAEMLNAGKLDWEAYVWTEGFENWLPMRDVPDLVTAISGPPESEPQAQPEPVRVAVGAPAYSAAQPSMGADPFADEGGGGGGGMFASAAQPAAARPNLFVAGSSSQADNPFEAEGRVVASAPSPRVSMDQAMTGARNENSVLFSLKNLQALATGSSAPSAAPMSSPPGRPGFAGGEGSGLIDIRALASATGVNDQSGKSTEKDALLSLGSAQTGAFGALGSPMLTPPTRDDETSKKGLVVAIVGGFALLAIAGIAAALILKPTSTPVATPVVPPPTAAPAPPTSQAPAAAAPTAEPPSEGEQQAAKMAAERAAAERAASAAAASGDQQQARPNAGGAKRPERGAADPAPAKPDPVAAAPDDKPKPRAGGSSLDDLLESAIGGKKPAGASASAAASTANLPEKPSRDDVLAAMNGVKAGVSACAKGQTGVAFANITVAGKTGRVSNVEVTGMTGEVGSCIARTVRKANFPKFKSDNFQVKFPFRI